MKSLIFRIQNLILYLVAIFYGFRVKQAKTQEENDSANSLRYQIYKEKKYIVPELLSNKEVNKRGESSINFLLYKNGELCGTCRLIYNNEYGFYTESFFKIDPICKDSDRDKVVELSGFVVKDVSKRRVGSMALFMYVLEYSYKNKFKYLYATMPSRLRDYISRSGLNFELINEKDLTQKQIENRKLTGDYFKQDIHPYYIIMN